MNKNPCTIESDSKLGRTITRRFTEVVDANLFPVGSDGREPGYKLQVQATPRTIAGLQALARYSQYVNPSQRTSW